jgi:hypothetical protein
MKPMQILLFLVHVKKVLVHYTKQEAHGPYRSTESPWPILKDFLCRYAFYSLYGHNIQFHVTCRGVHCLGTSQACIRYKNRCCKYVQCADVLCLCRIDSKHVHWQRRPNTSALSYGTWRGVLTFVLAQ